VVIDAFASAVFRPAQWALLPSLVRTPEELIAGNVAYAMIEGVGTLLGPALGGVLVAVADLGVAFVAAACVSLYAALITRRIKAPTTEAGQRRAGTRTMKEALAGFRTIATDSHSRMVVGLFGARRL
jgi:hypothetical protein